jgi:hypothetical protein
MPILQADDIADLITTTQRNLGEMKWTDLSYSLQEHIALPQLLNKNKVSFNSGTGIQWNLMIGTTGATRETGLYATDAVNVSDVMITANIPWRHITTSYAIERREIAINRSPAQIVDLVRIRRHDAMVDMAGFMETRFWRRPNGTSDTLSIYGVPYWITWTDNSSTNPNGGFDGGNPTGFSSGAANVDSNTYSQWKNWCAKYTSVTKDDLIQKWRRASTFTNFKAPVAQPDYQNGNMYGYYTNYNVIGQLERVLETQNDNLGNDIASKDGRVTFRQVPVTWCPHLEGRNGDPIYGINWGAYRPVFLSGEYMREEGPTKASNQHTVFQTFIDTTMNLQCVNRRVNFVLATATPDVSA